MTGHCAGCAGRPRSTSGLVLLRSSHAARRPASVTTTCGSPATTAPSSRPSPPGGWPTTRRSTRASRRSPTDAGAAGTENWFVLVNTPPGIRLDAVAEQRRVLDVLAARGVDLRDRVAWSDVITPLQLAARTGAPGGAIYGTSSDGRRAAFLRPGNRGARRGLFLVGGSSHPGGGLPLVSTERPHRRRDGRAVTPRRAVVLVARIAAATAVVPHVARAARRLPPIAPASAPQRLAVVIPARDEATAHRAVARRGRRCRRESTRSSWSTTSRPTRRRPSPRAAGARVVAGQPAPAGWAGKAWALQQGLDAVDGAVGRVARRRHPSVTRPARRARGPSDRRRPRPAHGRRPLRVLDCRAALAAPGAADDARLPRRAARRGGAGSGASPHRQRPVHGRPPRGAAWRQEASAPSPTTPSRTSRWCGRWRQPDSLSATSTRRSCSPCGCTRRRPTRGGGGGARWPFPASTAAAGSSSRSRCWRSPRPRRSGALVARRADLLDVVLLALRPARWSGRPALTRAAGRRTGCRRPPTSSPSPRWSARASDDRGRGGVGV